MKPSNRMNDQWKHYIIVGWMWAGTGSGMEVGRVWWADWQDWLGEY